MSMHTTAQANELRAFFTRARPFYCEIFNMAHAICGNYELAEYAVQSALLDCFRRGAPRSRAGLRESLRAGVRRAAIEQARLIDDAEPTWDGFCEDAIEGARGDVVLQIASTEGVEARRALMLRYGCGLRSRKISRLTGMPVKQVRDVLSRFERRVKRRLPPRERARIESRIARSARAWMDGQSASLPDPGAVYRGLEAELMESGAPGRSVSRVIARVLTLVLALIVAGLFWLVMILLEPPQMETPGAVSTPAVSQTAAPEDVFEAAGAG